MTPSLGTLPIDLPRLLETRALVQAASSGGKSWCLRRLLEQTASQVQQLVIDSEGEFATLRERFDYIVCAPHGADAVANPQTAAALARALWKAGTSAILDIYDLKKHERILFVRRFVEALVSAPRSMWHSTLVVIDECHDFAPQTGSAESSGAVIDLATRGRKRGLALVAATQRLSKLHKDVAAETLNKLIGLTSLDVDVQRAADELGMNKRDATEALRALNPGEFYAYGPALSRTVTRTMIGAVTTTHPQIGHRELTAPPPASVKVLAALAKLEGVQREVEAEAKTVDELRAEVATLKRKATLTEKASTTGVPEAEIERRVSVALASAVLDAEARGADRERVTSRRELEKLTVPLAKIRDLVMQALGEGFEAMTRDPPPGVPAPRPRAASPAPAPSAPAPIQGMGSHTVPQQRILDALARLHSLDVQAPNKATVAAMAGVSSKSSGYANNLGALRGLGLVEYPAGGCVALTDAGQGQANLPDKPLTQADVHEAWLAMVTRPQADLLRILIAHYPGRMNKSDLAFDAKVSATSSGFANNLGALRSLGAIEYPYAGHVAATPLLFPIGKVVALRKDGS